MILLIDTSSHSLSAREFVRPVRELLIDARVKNFREVTADDIAAADRIIICGNALQDQEVLKEEFSWLTTCDKPVLAICAGMQVLARAFGASLRDSVIIGVKRITIAQDDAVLGKPRETPVYELHTKAPSLPDDFIELARSGGNTIAMKHKRRPVWGVLFHPEALNKEMIQAFARG